MEVEVDEARRMMEVAEGVVEGLRSEREASEKRQEREVEVFKVGFSVRATSFFGSVADFE